jgi:hypothetical protein
MRFPRSRAGYLSTLVGAVVAEWWNRHKKDVDRAPSFAVLKVKGIAEVPEADRPPRIADLQEPNLAVKVMALELNPIVDVHVPYDIVRTLFQVVGQEGWVRARTDYPEVDRILTCLERQEMWEKARRSK